MTRAVVAVAIDWILSWSSYSELQKDIHIHTSHVVMWDMYTFKFKGDRISPHACVVYKCIHKERERAQN